MFEGATPGKTSREILTEAAEAYEFLPFDTLAFHNPNTVVLLNGMEALYVTLPQEVTDRGVAEAMRRMKEAGLLARTTSD